MTSIFDTSFSSNLQRLNSSQEPQREADSPNGKKFAKVLSDAEHRHEKPHDTAVSAHKTDVRDDTPDAPVPTFSNLRSNELVGLPATSPPMMSSVISYENPLYTSVRMEPPTVKVSAPPAAIQPAINQPPAPPIAAAPTLKAALAPTIITPDATHEIGDKPATPTLVSAERMTTIPEALLPEAIDPDPDALEDGDGGPTIPQIASIERLPDKPLNTVGKTYGKREAIKEIIATAGKYYGIDPNLSMAVAQVESAYDPSAISKDGHRSKGIFQLLDTTGKHMLGHVGMKGERYEPFDPAQNAYLGVGYLRRLHDIFSEETNLGSNMRTVPARSAEQLEKLAVAAFNAGEGSVARAQAKARALGKNPADYSAVEPHLPASTRLYVKRVTGLKRVLAKDDSEETIV